MSGHLLTLLGVSVLAGQQSSVPSEQLLHAIVGAKIEIGDGRVIEHGNVILRNGIIVAVGENATVPAGAQILDGKGLVVYPGFIEGYSSKGLKLPELQPDPDSPPDFGAYAPASMRVANRKGIHPELNASSFLALTDDVRLPYLKAGFTTALIAPSDGNFSGYGTLVNLGARPKRESIVVASFGQSLSLSNTSAPVKGQRYYYPGTILGTTALVRQTLLDSQRHEVASGATVGERAPTDPALEALWPVLHRRSPVLLDASTHAWVERSMDVCDEFGLEPVIVGGEEAWKSIDRLKKAHTQIIAAVDFGPEPETNPEPKTEPTKPPEPISYTDEKDDLEVKSRLGERERLYMQRVTNLIQLDKAGLPFALSSRGCKDLSEFSKNLRRLLKEGLPRTTILKALTLVPASILKRDQVLGTVAVGKFADLTVMSGDFLDEKTKVKMLYIDGRRLDPFAPSTAAAPRPTFGGEN